MAPPSLCLNAGVQRTQETLWEKRQPGAQQLTSLTVSHDLLAAHLPG